MSGQAPGPLIPAEPQPIVYLPAPAASASVWKIAAAVFVGNLLCALLSAVLYFCVVFGAIILAGATRR